MEMGDGLKNFEETILQIQFWNYDRKATRTGLGDASVQRPNTEAEKLQEQVYGMTQVVVESKSKQDLNNACCGSILRNPKRGSRSTCCRMDRLAMRNMKRYKTKAAQKRRSITFTFKRCGSMAWVEFLSDPGLHSGQFTVDAILDKPTAFEGPSSSEKHIPEDKQRGNGILLKDLSPPLNNPRQ
uniref:Uncharacterized protein n=1 Tax=Tanacetum cinerariifolium TaxID=118510 RepID=A0A6L2P274_TANCI|nr:hypothetical protein [Tanacetum cinerariifolium]